MANIITIGKRNNVMQQDNWNKVMKKYDKNKVMETM